MCERGVIQIGADDPKVSILVQDLRQAAPDQRIKASENDGDVSSLVIRPLAG
ncbi:MAG TPA: hypothetical protein VK790_04035 [Solirubrobacteraceae bacterium]|nr:hypothetical protein [Solirubrobacteraceae bacterium]